jgi:hypothetical protein
MKKYVILLIILYLLKTLSGCGSDGGNATDPPPCFPTCVQTNTLTCSPTCTPTISPTCPTCPNAQQKLLLQ